MSLVTGTAIYLVTLAKTPEMPPRTLFCGQPAGMTSWGPMTWPLPPSPLWLSQDHTLASRPSHPAHSAWLIPPNTSVPPWFLSTFGLLTLTPEAPWASRFCCSSLYSGSCQWAPLFCTLSAPARSVELPLLPPPLQTPPVTALHICQHPRPWRSPPVSPLLHSQSRGVPRASGPCYSVCVISTQTLV